MQDELALASRNSGMPLEALRYDVTPAGLHYLLIHFDIPRWMRSPGNCAVGGLVSRPAHRPRELQRMPAGRCA
jgi:hypothetical protein